MYGCICVCTSELLLWDRAVLALLSQIRRSLQLEPVAITVDHTLELSVCPNKGGWSANPHQIPRFRGKQSPAEQGTGHRRLSAYWGMFMDFFSEAVYFRNWTKALFPKVSLGFLSPPYARGSLDKCAFWNVSQLPPGPLGECQQISSISNMSGGMQLFPIILKTLVTGRWSGTTVHQGTIW